MIDTKRPQITTNKDILSRKYEVVVLIKREPRMVVRVPVEARSELEACHKVILRGVATPEHGVVNWGAKILSAEEVHE